MTIVKPLIVEVNYALVSRGYVYVDMMALPFAPQHKKAPWRDQEKHRAAQEPSLLFVELLCHDM